jgi:hypothetical protein
MEGAAPVFFGPCTLRRTWGTRPGKRALFFAQGQSGHRPVLPANLVCLGPVEVVIDVGNIHIYPGLQRRHLGEM